MSEADNIAAILAALKKAFRAAGVQHKHIAETLGVSLMTVKRLMSGKGMKLATLIRLCGIIDLTIFELLANVQRAALNETPQVSPEQTQILCDDFLLATIFILLERGWSIERISREFALGEVELTAILTRMDRLQFIALYPGNRIRLLRRSRAAGDLSTPGTTVPSARISDFFSPLDEILADPSLTWTSGIARLSDASLKRVAELFEQAKDAVFDLSEQDLRLPADEVKWYATLAIARPFTINQLKNARPMASVVAASDAGSM